MAVPILRNRETEDKLVLLPFPQLCALCYPLTRRSVSSAGPSMHAAHSFRHAILLNYCGGSSFSQKPPALSSAAPLIRVDYEICYQNLEPPLSLAVLCGGFRWHWGRATLTFRFCCCKSEDALHQPLAVDDSDGEWGVDLPCLAHTFTPSTERTDVRK
jgi:hypothetical protein